MTWLWGPLGRAFAGLDPVDVIADCGRLGADTPLLDLMREADLVVLLTRATLEQVAHLRERVAALTTRLRGGPPIGVLVLADPRSFRASIAEVDRILAGARGRARPDPADGQGPPPPDVTVLGGLALDPKGAELLSGRWGGRLDRSLLIRSAREVAAKLVARIATTRPGPAAGPPPPVPPPPGAQTAPGGAKPRTRPVRRVHPAAHTRPCPRPAGGGRGRAVRGRAGAGERTAAGRRARRGRRAAGRREALDGPRAGQTAPPGGRGQARRSSAGSTPPTGSRR